MQTRAIPGREGFFRNPVRDSAEIDDGGGQELLKVRLGRAEISASAQTFDGPLWKGSLDPDESLSYETSGAVTGRAAVVGSNAGG